MWLRPQNILPLMLFILGASLALDPAVHLEHIGELGKDHGKIHGIVPFPITTLIAQGSTIRDRIVTINPLGAPNRAGPTRGMYTTVYELVVQKISELDGLLHMDQQILLPHIPPAHVLARGRRDDPDPVPSRGHRSKRNRRSGDSPATFHYERVVSRQAEKQRTELADLIDLVQVQVIRNEADKAEYEATKKTLDQSTIPSTSCLCRQRRQVFSFQDLLQNNAHRYSKPSLAQQNIQKADEAREKQLQEAKDLLFSATQDGHQLRTATADMKDQLVNLRLQGRIKEKPEPCNCETNSHRAWSNKKDQIVYCDYHLYCRTYGYGWCSDYPDVIPTNPGLLEAHEWRSALETQWMESGCEELGYKTKSKRDVATREIDEAYQEAFQHQHLHPLFRQRRDLDAFINTASRIGDLVGTVAKFAGPVGWAIGLVKGIFDKRAIDKIRALAHENKRGLQVLTVHLDEVKSAVNDNRNAINTINTAVLTAVHQMKDFQEAAGEDHDILALALSFANVASTTMQQAAVFLDNRFPTGLVTPDNMQNLLQTMAERAASAGYTIMVDTIDQALRLPTSYAHTDTGFEILLHLPMSQDLLSLQLYRLRQVPEPMSNGQYITFHPEKDVLAVSTDRRFFTTMSLAELTLCQNLGRLKWCDQGTALRKSASMSGTDTNECMMHLFNGDSAKVATSCPTKISGPATRVESIGPSTFLTSSVRSQSVSIICPGKMDSFLTVDQVTQVTLAPGCRTETEDWYIQSILDVHAGLSAPVFDWTKALFEHHTAAGTPGQPITTPNLPDILPTFDLSPVEEQALASQAKPLTVFKVICICVATILGFLLCGVLGLTIYFRQRVKAQLKEAHRWTQEQLSEVSKNLEPYLLHLQRLAPSGLRRLTGPLQQPNPIFGEA